MHTLVEVPVGSNGGTHVPAFLAKLWKIVDDPSTNDLIAWSDMGNSFIIKNQAKFARDLLPLYYKHNNMASFVRQLNMYGFHKVVSVEQGGLRVDKDEMEFAHPFFLKGQEASLELIKRKIPASKHEESRMRPDSFNKVLLDVRQMKGRQESMDNKLVTMKRENEALWRELASLRQKHAKQTQIVSKLLQFLVGMMSQQTPRLAFKRRMPLMLNDKDGLKQKLARADAADGDSTGPVIHDVTELLESDDSGDDVDQDCQMNADALKVDPLGIAEIAGAVVGHNGPVSPEMMFSVNPIAVNPAVSVPVNNFALQQPLHTDQNKQNVAKAKAKSPGKKTSTTVASTLAAMKTEAGNVAFQIPQQAITTTSPSSAMQSQQMLQIPGMPSVTSEAQTAVPTTLYFSAPGLSEPVQVVLSVPDQATSTVPSSSGLTNITSPIIVPSTSSIPTTAVNKAANLQPPSPMTTLPLNRMSPISNGSGSDVIGRNHTLNNPKIFAKANGIHGQQDLDGHLDEMEVGLNSLRDLFKGQEYNVDNDTLIGVSTTMQPYYNVGAHDPAKYMQQLFSGSPPSADNVENQSTTQNYSVNFQGTGGEPSTQGHEVMTYNPSLFELAGEDSNFFDDSSNIYLDDELESMLTTDRDSLKRPEGQNRGVGQLSFTGINLNHSLDSGLNTPINDSAASPATSVSGSSKRKRK